MEFTRFHTIREASFGILTGIPLQRRFKKDLNAEAASRGRNQEPSGEFSPVPEVAQQGERDLRSSRVLNHPDEKVSEATPVDQACDIQPNAGIAKPNAVSRPPHTKGLFVF